MTTQTPHNLAESQAVTPELDDPDHPYNQATQQLDPQGSCAPEQGKTCIADSLAVGQQMPFALEQVVQQFQAGRQCNLRLELAAFAEQVGSDFETLDANMQRLFKGLTHVEQKVEDLELRQNAVAAKFFRLLQALRHAEQDLECDVPVLPAPVVCKWEEFGRDGDQYGLSRDDRVLVLVPKHFELVPKLYKAFRHVVLSEKTISAWFKGHKSAVLCMSKPPCVLPTQKVGSVTLAVMELTRLKSLAQAEVHEDLLDMLDVPESELSQHCVEAQLNWPGPNFDPQHNVPRLQRVSYLWDPSHVDYLALENGQLKLGADGFMEVPNRSYKPAKQHRHFVRYTQSPKSSPAASPPAPVKQTPRPRPVSPDPVAKRQRIVEEESFEESSGDSEYQE